MVAPVAHSLSATILPEQSGFSNLYHEACHKRLRHILSAHRKWRTYNRQDNQNMLQTQLSLIVVNKQLPPHNKVKDSRGTAVNGYILCLAATFQGAYMRAVSI